MPQIVLALCVCVYVESSTTNTGIVRIKFISKLFTVDLVRSEANQQKSVKFQEDR